MPTYRVITEIDARAEHRASRGSRFAEQTGAALDRQIQKITAETLAELASLLESTARRVVSIEEIHPGFPPSDAEIDAALTAQDDYGFQRLDPDEFSEDETPLYESLEFLSTVHDVVETLRESGLIPGLNISLLDNLVDGVDYTQIEIYDEALGIYRARGAEVSALTEDRSAAGWDGVLAIARSVIALSNDLH